MDPIRKKREIDRLEQDVDELRRLASKGSEDELKRLVDWLAANAGADAPWHISRFYPQYKCLDSEPTPVESLERAYNIGKAAGLRYVYVGNMPGSRLENTFCYKCGKMLIERVGYKINANRIKDSSCPDCGTKIAGKW